MSDNNSLTDLLLYYVYMEQELNNLRELLCSGPNFSPYNLFKEIDSLKQYPQGYLQTQDIDLLFKYLKFPNNLPTILYIQNYNQNDDGVLVYSEFLKSILPYGNTKLREKVTQQDPNLSYNVDDKTKFLYGKLIEAEIKLTQQAETYKNEYNMDIFYYYSQGKNHLTPQDLTYYFQDRYIDATQEEIQIIFNKIDILNDFKIDHNEWKLFTCPRRSLPLQQKKIINKQTKQRYHSESRKQYDNTMTNLSGLSPQQAYYVSQKPPLQYGTEKYRDQKTKLRAEMQLSLIMNEPRSSSRKPYIQTNKKNCKQTILDEIETQKKQMVQQKQMINCKYKPIEYFNQLFFQMTEQLIKIERQKQLLCAQNDFSLFGCFHNLDKGQKGYLNVMDLKQYLKNPKLLINSYGRDNKLRFSDFIKIIEPYNQQSIDIIQRREQKYNNNNRIQVMGTQTNLSLKLLFELFETIETMIEQARNYLKTQSLTLRDLFYMLSFDKVNITLQDIMNFLQSNSIHIELLLNKLDVDYDGNVSFQDFSHLFGQTVKI